MVKVVIVEDDLFFLTYLESKLKEIGGYQILGVADTVVGAYNIIRAKVPDIIISDISLKGNNNGLELGHLIKERGIPILYITESQDKQTYHRAEEVPMSSFLVKPFHILTLDSAIHTLLAIKTSAIYAKGLMYSAGGVKQIIANEDILYVESDKNYCTVNTVQGKFAYKISIVKMLEKLNQNWFVRVHKSYVVNINKISSFSLTEGYMYIDNKKVSIGRTYKKSLMEVLSQ